MEHEATRNRVRLLSTAVDVVDFADALSRLDALAEARRGYACLVNVHSLVTAERDQRLAAALAGSSLNLPDGQPVAWAMRKKGRRGQQRICGPDLLPALCRQAAESGRSVFFFGSTPRVLDGLRKNLARRFPGLKVAGALSPPFRTADATEDAAHVATLNASKAAVVFVGLGCPKQEIWMAEHANRVNALMVGVGAAFDFAAGHRRRAPGIVSRLGLEWLFRLGCEPRRLFTRYLSTNTAFALHWLRGDFRPEREGDGQ